VAPLGVGAEIGHPEGHHHRFVAQRRSQLAGQRDRRVLAGVRPQRVERVRHRNLAVVGLCQRLEEQRRFGSLLPAHRVAPRDAGQDRVRQVLRQVQIVLVEHMRQAQRLHHAGPVSRRLANRRLLAKRLDLVVAVAQQQALLLEGRNHLVPAPCPKMDGAHAADGVEVLGIDRERTLVRGQGPVHPSAPPFCVTTSQIAEHDRDALGRVVDLVHPGRADGRTTFDGNEDGVVPARALEGLRQALCGALVPGIGPDRVAQGCLGAPLVAQGRGPDGRGLHEPVARITAVLGSMGNLLEQQRVGRRIGQAHPARRSQRVQVVRVVDQSPRQHRVFRGIHVRTSHRGAGRAATAKAEEKLPLPVAKRAGGSGGTSLPGRGRGDWEKDGEGVRCSCSNSSSNPSRSPDRLPRNPGSPDFRRSSSSRRHPNTPLRS